MYLTLINFIHSQLDSAKVLEMGFFTCCHSHLQHVLNMDSTPEAVIRRATVNGNASGLWRTDVFKQDRQNFMACVRRAGYKVRRALIQLQPRGSLNMSGPSPRTINRSFLPAINQDPATIPVLDAVFLGSDDLPWGSNDPEKPANIKTQGTVAFYCLCAATMLIHHSMYFGILQRVRFAGFVNMFVAHWRCWVLKTPGLTLGDNFLTKECYSDLVQSCHEAVLQIIVFKDYAPSLPLRLDLSGSNNCENSFSGAGGYRGMHGKRNYNVLDYVKWVGKQYVMHILSAAGVNRGRSQHSKQEWDSRLHEPKLAREELDRLLRDYPDLQQMTKAWNAGAEDASSLAQRIGLKHGVSDDAWADPWTVMKEKLHVEEVFARTVADDGDGGDEDHEHDKDDDDLHRLRRPPPGQTCGIADIEVPVLQLLKARMPPPLAHKVACFTYQYLFLQAVDRQTVNEIMYELAVSEEPAESRSATRATETFNKFVTMPGTQVQISKKQLVYMMVQDVLRCGRADGTNISKDRIARIKSTAARVKAEQEGRLEAAVEGERAHLQDDLAFCFIHDDGSKKLWLGKLQQMRSKKGKRSRNLHQSVDLCDPPDDLQMQCQWYHETQSGSRRYVPSARTVNIDRSFVHVTSCLGLVKLRHCNGIYTIDPLDQLERFKRLMRTI